MVALFNEDLALHAFLGILVEDQSVAFCFAYSRPQSTMPLSPVRDFSSRTRGLLPLSWWWTGWMSHTELIYLAKRENGHRSLLGLISEAVSLRVEEEAKIQKRKLMLGPDKAVVRMVAEIIR